MEDRPANADLASLRVDGARLWRTIERAAEIGPGRAGGLRRLTLTDEDRDVRDQFVSWCEEPALGLVVDQAGKMFSRLKG